MKLHNALLISPEHIFDPAHVLPRWNDVLFIWAYGYVFPSSAKRPYNTSYPFSDMYFSLSPINSDSCLLYTSPNM